MPDALYDKSKIIVALSACFIPLCTIFVGLRLYIRQRSKRFGADDWLLLLGLILWLTSTGFVIPAAYNGVGMHIGHYTVKEAVVGLKWFFVFLDLHIWAIIPIKISICWTLTKFTAKRYILWILYGLMFITFANSFATNIYLLTSCNKIQANWNAFIPGAKCRSAKQTVRLADGHSAICIVIDWTVSLLPIVMMWNIQMSRKMKVTVIFILGLGIIASTATLVRMKSLVNFSKFTDYLFGLGDIVIWSIVEPALALICAALLSFRPLVRHLLGSSRSEATERPSAGLPGDPYRVTLDCDNESIDSGNVSRSPTFFSAASQESAIPMSVIYKETKYGKEDTESQRSIMGSRGTAFIPSAVLR